MAETDPGGQQIKDCKGKIDDYEDSVTLALLIEASCESSFQFFFQTLYRFGINIKFIKGKLYWLKVTYCLLEHLWRGSEWPFVRPFHLEKYFNLWIFLHALLFLLCYQVRIVATAAVAALPDWFCRINQIKHFRNHSKKGALKMIHFGWILSRIVFDTLGKISIVFVWTTLMDPAGNFQPLLVFFIYYGVFFFLVIFNIVFNTCKVTCSLEYIIGQSYCIHTSIYIQWCNF